MLESGNDAYSKKIFRSQPTV